MAVALAAALTTACGSSGEQSAAQRTPATSTTATPAQPGDAPRARETFRTLVDQLLDYQRRSNWRFGEALKVAESDPAYAEELLNKGLADLGEAVAGAASLLSYSFEPEWQPRIKAASEKLRAASVANDDVAIACFGFRPRPGYHAPKGGCRAIAEALPKAMTEAKNALRALRDLDEKKWAALEESGFFNSASVAGLLVLAENASTPA